MKNKKNIILILLMMVIAIEIIAVTTIFISISEKPRYYEYIDYNDNLLNCARETGSEE